MFREIDDLLKEIQADIQALQIKYEIVKQMKHLMSEDYLTLLGSHVDSLSHQAYCLKAFTTKFKVPYYKSNDVQD